MEEDIQKFANIINNLPNLQPQTKAKLIEDFRSALRTGQLTDYFPKLGSGSYKICCALDPEEHYVIKFQFSFGNPEEEIKIANNLWKDLGERIFLPAWGFQLEKDYFPDYDYDEDDYDEDEEIPYLSFVMIQPRITFLVNDDSNNQSIYDFDYDKEGPSPIIDKKTSRSISNADVRNSQIASVTWLQAIVDNYGIDFCETFLSVINNNCIADLYSENIGYIDVAGTLLPVIIDFM